MIYLDLFVPDDRNIIWFIGLQMPLDVSSLSESEAKQRIERRKPKTKVKAEVEEVNTFSSKKYLHLIKKNKKGK